MRSVRAYHPILFALFPVLYLYSRNIALLPPSDVIHPALITLGATLALWLILGLMVRDMNRAAAPISLLALLFFSFGPVCAAIRSHVSAPEAEGLRGVVMPYWIGGMVILVVGLAWKGSLKPATTSFLNLMGVTLVAITLGSTMLAAIRLNKDVASIRLGAVPGAELPSASLTMPPDIYYIILDGFGRTDALEQFIGISNKDFIGELEKRGFYVAKRSHSNYAQTEQSLASSLNLEYLPGLVAKVDPSSSDRAPLDELIDDNRVARFLRGKGYGYVAVTTGFPSVRATAADIELGGKSAVNLLEATLIGNTPLDLSQGEMTSQYNMRREGLLSAFENLGNLGAGGARPRFIFTHILAPHPPFVFGPNGEPRRPRGTFGYWDGSDYMTYVGPAEQYASGYRDQLVFIQKQVLKAVDSILAKSKTRPIIMIQGDHGSKLHLDQGSLAGTDVRECFKNLSTYYVPEPLRNRLYPSITPVNTFRLILDELFDARLPLLPDKSYYSTFPEPYRYAEVTSQIEDPVETAKPPGSPDHGAVEAH